MNLKRRYWLIILTLVAGLIALAVGVWVAIIGWPPIVIHDRLYRELVSGFQRAQRTEELRRGDGNGGWEFEVQVPEKQTTVLVREPSSVGVVTIKYADEGDSRALYRYADKTTPVEIRHEHNVLYVRWLGPLFGPNHWILAYDLAARREIAKRRLDPKDISINSSQ